MEDENQENPVPSIEDAELNIAKRYLGNVLEVSQISVTRVVVKTPSKIHNPDFQKDLYLWEQLWSSTGELLLERQLDFSKL